MGVRQKELVRQIFHAFTGTLAIINIRFEIIPFNYALIIFILLYLITSLVSKLQHSDENIGRLVKFFERGDTKFGQGAVILMMAYLLLHFISKTFIDTQSIALASMTIVTFGDSINTMIGIYTKGYILPYNKKKHTTGLIASIIAASIGASIWISPYIAIFVSTISMVIESFDFTLFGKKIDDNILIPMVSILLLYIFL